MSLTIILGIIIVHYIADFVLQTNWQAINKSKNIFALLIHTMNYSSVFIYLGILVIPIFDLHHNLYLFGVITFVFHTITDYFTSKWSSYLYQKGQRHNFFLVVGFDQVLHYIQLFTTYYILTN